MSDTRLLPCPSCTRHVRASEGTCPFCDAELSAARSAVPLPRAPGARLSRAALYALGASAAVVAAACGGTTSASTFGDGGADASDELHDGPLYGGPPVDASTDGPFLVDAAYGGPPQDAADAASDAEDDATPDAIAPPYGAPP